MNDTWNFQIRYWGVTGSMARCEPLAESEQRIASAISQLLEQGDLAQLVDSGADMAAIRRTVHDRLPRWLRSGFGGNTTCIEVNTPNELIILDAGGGLRPLGIDLARRWREADSPLGQSAHLLLTHSHMDHLHAAPFFEPFYDARNDFTIWGPQKVLDSLAALLDADSPAHSVFYPLSLDRMPGIRRMIAIEADTPFEIGTTRVIPIELNHPGAAVGYRLERGGRAVVFASDHEIVEPHDTTGENKFSEMLAAADLWYADSQYLLEEYEGNMPLPGQLPGSRAGWGHSTVEAVVTTADKANVKCLHLGHHDPARSNAGLAQFESLAQKLAQPRSGQPSGQPQVQLAYEGLTVRI